MTGGVIDLYKDPETHYIYTPRRWLGMFGWARCRMNHLALATRLHVINTREAGAI